MDPTVTNRLLNSQYKYDVLNLLDEFFNKHPREVGMSYGHHFDFAFSIGFSMFLAGLALMLHAFCPMILQSIGSRRIKEANRKITSPPDDDDYEYWSI
jgi:hypothetical protein